MPACTGQFRPAQFHPARHRRVSDGKLTAAATAYEVSQR